MSEWNTRRPHWYGDEAHQHPATETGPEMIYGLGYVKAPFNAHENMTDMEFAGHYIQQRYGGTPEQKERARKQAEQRQQERQCKREAATPAARKWWQELQHDAGFIPAVWAVLNLHWPQDDWMSCSECDGFEDGWPCPTIYAMSEHLGSGPVPDGIEHVRRGDLK